MVTFNYIGHAAFTLDDGKTTLLFDPFITGNPAATVGADKIHADYILVSHGHGDHLGDAGAIALRAGATVIGVPEIIDACGAGVKGHGMNIGGSYQFPFGKVYMTQAIHSAGVAGAIAGGFVVEFGGKTIYFAGDTAVFSDMAIIGQKFQLDYAILPIGDNFTMGVDDAGFAAALLLAKNVIPVHYNTWPVIAADPQKFKKMVEEKTKTKVHVVAPGESHTLK